ncbi:Hypothetical protein CINCED_3A017099 [Cinara cedri]|nr:Hypothetical protein CINCED_3A017099 [Cinara cedri]
MPQIGSDQAYALQQPFATLFDNLITVLWVVYNKKSTLKIGINQLQWALEFMRSMKVEYGYPECIGKIVSEFEDQLIMLYSMVGKKIDENNQKNEVEISEKNVNDKSSKSFGIENAPVNGYMSYNEEDIMNKLDTIKIVIDPVTRKSKYLNELNSLGKRKERPDRCAAEQKSSKNSMIDALEKLLKKTTYADTKTGVKELIKELKVEGPPAK